VVEMEILDPGPPARSWWVAMVLVLALGVTGTAVQGPRPAMPPSDPPAVGGPGPVAEPLRWSGPVRVHDHPTTGASWAHLRKVSVQIPPNRTVHRQRSGGPVG